MGKLISRSAGTSPACHSPETLPSLAKAHHRVGMLLLAMALGSSTFAQPAGKVDSKSSASDSSAPQDSKGAVPSRFVEPAGLTPYLESLSSKFLIRGRVRDSFGKIQDPTVKPVAPAPTASGLHRPRPIQTTPFTEVIQKITITTVMPGEKRFLLGTRSFKQGDQMPLTYRGKPIRAQITEVTSKQISFRNLESGETATRKLDLLPAGMTSGNHEITAPGMTPDRTNAPIELESGE